MKFLIQIVVGASGRELNCKLGNFSSSYCIPRHIYSLLIFYVNFTILELRKSENWVFSNCVRIRHTCQMFRRECRNRRIHQSMSIFRWTNFLWKDVLHVFHYDTWASESRPERVRLCVHTTEPTGPVPEPFHCDHIARWSARSGTTGCSGTGVNTGARSRSGPKAVV